MSTSGSRCCSRPGRRTWPPVRPRPGRPTDRKAFLRTTRPPVWRAGPGRARVRESPPPTARRSSSSSGAPRSKGAANRLPPGSGVRSPGGEQLCLRRWPRRPSSSSTASGRAVRAPEPPTSPGEGCRNGARRGAGRRRVPRAGAWRRAELCRQRDDRSPRPPGPGPKARRCHFGLELAWLADLPFSVPTQRQRPSQAGRASVTAHASWAAGFGRPTSRRLGRCRTCDLFELVATVPVRAGWRTDRFPHNFLVMDAKLLLCDFAEVSGESSSYQALGWPCWPAPLPFSLIVSTSASPSWA